ncbi:MAG: hypothetical protein Q4G33_09810 [bacterium]|nr:hypothetical protein [bacterium]
MGLDTNYNARTYLSRWWKQVHSNLLALWDRITNEIANEQSRVNTEIANERSRVNTELNKKADKTKYASVSEAGVIKLYSSSGTNRSGLVVYGDGSTVVNTKAERGVTRDGAGQIGINAATEEEIETGTDAYKPIVPATLRYSVESIAGKASDIKIYNSEGLPNPVLDIVSGVNILSGLLQDMIKSGAVGIIDNSQIKKLSTGGTYTLVTGQPDGIYFWIPDEQVSENCVSINGVGHTDEGGKGLFKKDYLYIIDTTENKCVIYSQYDEEQKFAKIDEEKLDISFKSNGFNGIDELTESVKSLIEDANSNGYAGLTEVTADLKELMNKNRYSKTPVKIGDWIDGTPIWRVAFKRNFTEEEANENNVSLWDIIPAKDKNTPFVVNYCVNAFFTSPGLVDDIPGKIGSNVVSFDVAKNTFYTSDGLYGWIEFATTENNIELS